MLQTIPTDSPKSSSRGDLQLIRIGRVIEITGISRSAIYSRMDRRSRYFDPAFPKPVSLSVQSRGAVAWALSEVQAWIDQRMQKR